MTSNPTTSKQRRLRGVLVNPFPVPHLWPHFGFVHSSFPARMPDAGLVSLAAAAAPHDVEVCDGIVSHTTFREFVAAAGDYDFIGIRAVSAYTALSAHMLAAAVKARAPGVTVILGGHHATLYHPQWFDFAGSDIDVIVLHEGERTFAELVDALAAGSTPAGIAGLAWRDADGTVHVERDRPLVANLDDLPFPRFDLWQKDGYDSALAGPPGIAVIEATRGCGNGCGYCVTGPMWKFHQRRKSVARVIRELDEVYRLGYRRLSFADDNLNDAPDWLNELCHAMAGRYPDMPWFAMMSARPFVQNPGLAEALARAGCKAVMIGFENASPVAALKLHKGSRARLAEGDGEAVFGALDRAGVEVHGLFMTSFPGETAEEHAAVSRVADTLCHMSTRQPYMRIHGTPDLAGAGSPGREDFYQVLLLSRPPTRHSFRGVLSARLPELARVAKQLLVGRRGSYSRGYMEYRLRNVPAVLAPPPREWWRLAALALDPRRSPKERIEAVVDAAIDQARRMGGDLRRAG